MYSMTLVQWSRFVECLDAKGVKADYKAMKNDGFFYLKSDPEGKAANHIHSFEHVDDERQIFTSLLPKASSFRSGTQIDLADEDLDDWNDTCHAMRQETRNVVRIVAECMRQCGAVKG